MTKNNSISRLAVLDGLRGLAILLVFFNHIDSSSLASLFTGSVFANFYTIIVTSGSVIGVPILFILSGFLMAYLYHNIQDTVGFWHKRYARIFPLYLSMTTVMMILHLQPSLSVWLRLLVILAVAVAGHLLWVHFIKHLSHRTVRMIFLSFILLQISVAMIYGFVIMRHPAENFASLPIFLQNITIYFVNLTLTVFMGDYISLLDGVYWSLASEILFYILYPIAILPMMQLFKKRKLWFKLALAVSASLLCLGLHVIAKDQKGWSLVQPVLFAYFITGLVLGNLYRNRQAKLLEVATLFRTRLGRWGSTVICIMIVASMSMLNNASAGLQASVIRLVYSFLIGIVIIVALDNTSIISSWLRQRWVVAIGTISYSIYLVHTPIVDTAKLIFTPQTWWQSLIFVTATFIVVIFFAKILYYLLERPYFYKSANIEKVNLNLKLPFLPYSLIVIYILLVVATFQSQFNLFSTEVSHKHNSTTPLSLHKDKPIKLQFVAQENNLGIIVLKPRHNSQDISAKLTFVLDDLDSDWAYTSTHYLNKISAGDNYVFGIPQITNSRGKHYLITLSTDNALSKSSYLDVKNYAFKSVYQLDKKTLLSQPSKLLTHLFTKIIAIFNNSQAQLAVALSLPFILLIYGSKVLTDKQFKAQYESTIKSSRSCYN